VADDMGKGVVFYAGAFVAAVVGGRLRGGPAMTRPVLTLRGKVDGIAMGGMSVRIGGEPVYLDGWPVVLGQLAQKRLEKARAAGQTLRITVTIEKKRRVR
jgi:hypothetical protein